MEQVCSENLGGVVVLVSCSGVQIQGSPFFSQASTFHWDGAVWDHFQQKANGTMKSFVVFNGTSGDFYL